MTSNANSNAITLRPPYPPNLKMEDFIDGLDFSEKSRGPNSFFIYRKSYVKYLKELNHRIPMTRVSQMASNCWKSEPRKVKKAYKQISRDIESELSRRKQKNPSLIFNVYTPSDADVILQSSRNRQCTPNDLPQENLINIDELTHRFLGDLNLTLTQPPSDGFDNSESDSDSACENHISDTSLPSNVLNNMPEWCEWNENNMYMYGWNRGWDNDMNGANEVDSERKSSTEQILFFN